MTIPYTNINKDNPSLDESPSDERMLVATKKTKRVRFDETKNHVIADEEDDKTPKHIMWYSVRELKQNRSDIVRDIITLSSDVYEAELVDLFDMMIQGERSVRLHRFVSLLMEEDRRHGLESKLAPTLHRPRRRFQNILRKAVISSTKKKKNTAEICIHLSRHDRRWAELLAYAHHQAIQCDL